MAATSSVSGYTISQNALLRLERSGEIPPQRDAWIAYFVTGIECDTGQRLNCPSLALGRNYRQLPTSERYARAASCADIIC